MESNKNNNNDSENTETFIPSAASNGDTTNIEWSEEFQCFTVNGIKAAFPVNAVSPEIEVESSEMRSQNDYMFFRLFKFPNDGEHYLLELHKFKVGGNIHYYQLLLDKSSNGEWKVKMQSVEPNYNYVVVPVLDDPTPPIFYSKYGLSLRDRLVGWTVVRKKESQKERKYYYHQGRQFRSLIEVATFLLYSNKPKGLQTQKTPQI